jgi:molecular chaperone GrpE
MNKNNDEKDSGEIEPEQKITKEKEPSDLFEMKQELEKAKTLAEENYGLYLRAVADAENVRKRLIKEVESSKRFALESFLRDVLVVLDGFDKALQTESLPENSTSFFDGVAIVRKQLFEILERNGLQEISAQGKKFDANLHQAIKRTESQEVSEETVDCEYAKGYKMFDKLLRPSIVSVLVPTINA